MVLYRPPQKQKKTEIYSSHYYLLLNPPISKTPSLSCQLFTGRGGGRAGGAELGLLGAAIVAM
jgi:hypothetical protein